MFFVKLLDSEILINPLVHLILHFEWKKSLSTKQLKGQIWIQFSKRIIFSLVFRSKFELNFEVENLIHIYEQKLAKNSEKNFFWYKLYIPFFFASNPKQFPSLFWLDLPIRGRL